MKIFAKAASALTSIKESVILAMTSVKDNKMRAFLTLLSISIGVFAIIGAGTLVTSIDNSINSELSDMGETTFFIRRMPSMSFGGPGAMRKYWHRKPITYKIAKDLKRELGSEATVCAYSTSSSQTLKSGNNSTNPDVTLLGTDENYFGNQNMKVESGRPLIAEDISFNRNVAIIGNDVVVKLFPDTDPIGKKFTLKNQTYEVIGILEKKGAVMGESQDNLAIIPISQLLRYFSNPWESSVNLSVKAPSKDELQSTIDEVTGMMRILRNQKPWEENSFEVETNETLSEQFGNLTKYLSYFGFISGTIALIAAGVGIMNIMLVSVKERTREIGIRKAIGAKRNTILFQFIVETITLCQIGGMFGIAGGIGGAALLAKGLMHVDPVFPVSWIIFAIVICTVLGLSAGAYPAWRAAGLDPIEALRYE